MATLIIVPTSDSAIAWSEPPSGTHYDDIDEGVGGPDSNFIQALQINGDDNDIDKFNLGNISIGGGTVKQLVVYTYGSINGASKPEVLLEIGVATFMDEDVELTVAPGWHTNTLVMDFVEAAINVMTLSYRADCAGGKEANKVFTCYIEVTYTPAGYGHDFMGVPAANIDSVNGIPSANIDTIKGV